MLRILQQAKKLRLNSAGNSKDIDAAVKAARVAFDSGAWTDIPNNEKGKIIWKIGDLIDKHAEELAQLESLDNGKPVAVAGAADVPLSSDIFRYMAGWATKKLKETQFPIHAYIHQVLNIIVIH